MQSRIFRLQGHDEKMRIAGRSGLSDEISISTQRNAGSITPLSRIFYTIRPIEPFSHIL
jgi:hypothetical protein